MPSDPFNTKQINLSGKPILREKIPLTIYSYILLNSIYFYLLLLTMEGN